MPCPFIGCSKPTTAASATTGCRTSASIEAQNEEERLNRENQLKLVPKKEEEIELEEDEDELKIKCEPDIGGDRGRYYKCS